MAEPYITEQSFIARLNVLNTKCPGPVGRWEYSPGYNGSVHWHQSTWLTTSRQDRDALQLWFGAVEYGDEGHVYEVRLWTSNSAHPMYNQRVDISTNGYLGFYELTPIVGPLWRVARSDDGKMRMTTLDGKGVGVHWDKAAWSTGRAGSYLRVGAEPSALFDVDIVQMGIEEPL
ncbi:hypothetical protein LOY46_22070 [Pseudomonas sichuanensis]|uniref:Uncharacterized protein n=1 Tax=Pseudomonas oryziphila TaxID=2894079 RepID=A0ABM7CVD9_9PSED|nr:MULTISPECIES: hypothetical protein [Pseudomonas]AZL75478.1 hypothetical protein EI693_21290 [Pseudomonas oryziphila]UVK82210.1 hypothetical protein LOY46_22070 [Pseudomonas sichuanensis]